MRAWVGGCAFLYWKYYEDLLETKTAITQVVEAAYDNAIRVMNRSNIGDVPQLTDGSFLRYDDIRWTCKDGAIRCFKNFRLALKQVDGKDSRIRLRLPPTGKIAPPRTVTAQEEAGEYLPGQDPEKETR
mmetsp:Transcript_11092/g.31900  ORF Transcript_11092/g.31900 Transcript_11092/m.31900 type:complete len:129 (+) Transcript_11092:520-906(+)